LSFSIALHSIHSRILQQQDEQDSDTSSPVSADQSNQQQQPQEGDTLGSSPMMDLNGAEEEIEFHEQEEEGESTDHEEGESTASGPTTGFWESLSTRSQNLANRTIRFSPYVVVLDSPDTGEATSCTGTDGEAGTEDDESDDMNESQAMEEGTSGLGLKDALQPPSPDSTKDLSSSDDDDDSFTTLEPGSSSSELSKEGDDIVSQLWSDKDDKSILSTSSAGDSDSDASSNRKTEIDQQ